MAFLTRLTPGSTSVGIDIGSSAVKVAQLQQTREAMTISKAGASPVPEGAVKGGVVMDIAAVAQSVRELLETLEIDTKYVTAGVSGPTVVVREVPLPAMSERQLRKSIQWEARSYISIPVEDSVIECEVLERPETGAGQMRVMLAAVPRDLLVSQTQTLELAGLEPLAVEIQPFSAMRGLLASDTQAEAPEETTALLGLGASYTEITILKEGTFVLTRSVPIAGNALTEAIKNSLDRGTAEAEQIKLQELQLVLTEEERARLGPTAQQASRAVEPLLDELVREVRRSLAYHDYQQQDADSGDLSVSQLLLSGGSALIPGIEAYFSAQLGVPVTVVRAFGGCTPAGAAQAYLESHAPELLVGVGLALREPLLARQRRSKGGSDG